MAEIRHFHRITKPLHYHCANPAFALPINRLTRRYYPETLTCIYGQGSGAVTPGQYGWPQLPASTE
jgi:hypothetical protein